MSAKAEAGSRYFRSGSVKFVSVMKLLLVLVSIAVLPAVMVLTAVACNVTGLPRAVYSVVIAVLAAGWLALYGAYALQVSMGTVIGLETTAKVVHLYTKRKTFTYDIRMGCVAVKVKGSRYLCTFETQDSRDKFTFYKHAPFSKYTDGQFTEEDIRSFCPAFDGEDFEMRREGGKA